MKILSITSKFICVSFFIFGCLIAESEKKPLEPISIELSHYLTAGLSANSPDVQSRENLNDAEEENKKNELKNEDVKTEAANLLNPLQAAIHYTSHSGVYHFLAYVDFLNEKIQLEDGSIWRISSSDLYKTANWLTTDTIIITPNHSWLSQDAYNFRFTNRATGTSIAVQLSVFLSPIYHTIYNYQIAAYDDTNSMIWLNDGSVWSVSIWDYSQKWQIGDTIIIGNNDGYFSNTKPNILINANLLNSVRAICVQ